MGVQNVNVLATSDTNSSSPMLFAGTWGSGVFVSSNNGISWTAASNGLAEYTNVYSIDVSGTNLFASTGVSVFLSMNNGSSWTTDTVMPKFQSFAMIGTNLFIGTGSGVLLSTNSGISWTAASNGLPDVGVSALAVIGSNLFAGTAGSGVFLSTNNGTSWTAASTGLSGNGYGVMDFGVSGTNLFAGTAGSGVFLSTNNGTSWTAVNTGFSDTSFTDTIIIVFALSISDTYLFAGTNAGVWRRPLSDFGFSAVAPAPLEQQSITTYPNPCTSSSTITFSCAESGEGEVTIFNLLGAEVARVYEGELSAGEHSFTWDASSAAPGMYECVVNVNGKVQRTAISLLK
jgi:hypothetical protein